ncbi:hypothetical protein RINTU1_24210 [Candidatus Regiella insecticola]|uniref:Uncharacterized protein n=1 Tax=Candidatus Regiella insecticola TaxID=138073 RepID=A0A6L2ZQ61_9ENTR|nr:hypothetical protein RINTU1_24210 [Candidatus Regiella insecticola]
MSVDLLPDEASTRSQQRAAAAKAKGIKGKNMAKYIRC